MSNQYPNHPFEWGVGDPAGNQRNLSGQTAFDIARARGLYLQPGNNELAPRIAAVNKLLTTVAANGCHAFQLHPRCKWLRDGFLHGYKFAQQRGTGRIADLPEKNDYSHVQDALQYVCQRSVGALFSAHGGSAGVAHDEFLRLAEQRNAEAQRSRDQFDPRDHHGFDPRRGGFDL
jgi:hypothetical protein